MPDRPAEQSVRFGGESGPGAALGAPTGDGPPRVLAGAVIIAALLLLLRLKGGG